MCSLCGIATKLESENGREQLDAVARMLRVTRHRGPDGVGVFARGSVWTASTEKALRDAVPDDASRARVILGQSRLAITGSRRIDGQQPFVSADGRLALTHNGEIYNHEDLVHLLGDDADTSTGSDSEVLMRILERAHAAADGDLGEAVRRTVGVASGMYALAVTDGETVVLARDAVGKKPLYYVAGDSRFAWASERKALADVARAEDSRIDTLKPGHVLVCGPEIRPEVGVVERLSQPAIDITTMDVAMSEYSKALERAIARRTRGLDRAAVLFSGGIDSVLVARMLQRAGLDVTGYVSGMEGSSDVRNAIQIAKRMGLKIRVVTVDEKTITSWLPTIIHHTELNGPLMVEVSVPMWFASRAAHEDDHRVIFTGQAADELFAGYSWYGDVLEEHGELTLHARMWEDLLRLPTDTLEREDRITMAWSLEMRAPFLDTDIIRTAFRTSPSLKIDGAKDPHRKHVHRRVAVAMGVPEDIAYREKIPAQDGASLHELLARTAAEAAVEATPDVADRVPDFGSNYRYRDTMGTYQTPEVYAMLERVARESQILVAAADGTAVAPPEIPGPRLQTPVLGALSRAQA